MQLEQKRL